MGRSLNLEVIAAGMETPMQADFLRALGCDEVQGYLYGKPMEASDFTKLLERSAAQLKNNLRPAKFSEARL